MIDNRPKWPLSITVSVGAPLAAIKRLIGFPRIPPRTFPLTGGEMTGVVAI